MAFSQFIVNGIIAGAVYALIAAGFSLIYYTNQFPHFAHGATVALTAYLMHYFFQTLSLGFGISIVLSILGAGVIGYLMDLMVYKQLRERGASSTILLIASIAILIFVQALILLLFGADVKTIGFLTTAKGISIFGFLITPLQITIIVSSLVLLGLTYLFMKKTRIGKAMRAVAGDKDVAEVLGISSERIYMYAFIVGSIISGAGAILIGMEQSIEPTMGLHLIIKGFTGAVIGGLTSVPGAVLGSFLLGIVENLGIIWLPSGYKDAIAFTLLFIFLLFKPKGILGIRKTGE